MRSVLVTGGAGYIGSHICKALAACGYTPVTYDNLVNGHRQSVKWGPFEHGDIGDRQRLDEVLTKYNPHAAIHVAGFAYVGESVSDPGKYYRNNTVGSLILLEALISHDIRRIIFSSSCATYGIPDSVPITEETVQKPINPYGMSKLVFEYMLKDFQVAHGLGWISLRYFNAAGADPETETGEDHDPETRIVPLVLAAADGLSGPVMVYGNDYDTPDGTCVRDYVHVSDLADAHIKALEALMAGEHSQALNLGTGTGHSVMEVINTAKSVTGRDVPFLLGPRREGDPAVLVADPSRANTILGWQPKHNTLDAIVTTAWKWHLKKKERQ
jgi:UDP-arabinose 4-epimerase